MAKVSVVIPTQNRDDFLQRAIQSVLGQTFQDFEIIVVDDASVDQTFQVVQSFADLRISYIRHENKKGQGATRNDGIRSASGEYVALLDDDDEWLPQKLEKQVSLLNSSPPYIGLVYTGFRKVDALTSEVLADVIPEKRGSLFEDLCVGNCIGTCSTVLVRRSCFEKIGLFDEGLASGADYDLWLRISKEVDIEYLREPLVLYNVHSRRISANHDSLVRGMEALLKKNAELFVKSTRSFSQRYLFLGVQYCYSGDLKKGREIFVKAMRLDPFEVRNYYNFGLSLLGSHMFRKIKEFRNPRVG